MHNIFKIKYHRVYIISTYSVISEPVTGKVGLIPDLHLTLWVDLKERRSRVIPNHGQSDVIEWFLGVLISHVDPQDFVSTSQRLLDGLLVGFWIHKFGSVLVSVDCNDDCSTVFTLLRGVAQILSSNNNLEFKVKLKKLITS